MVYVLFCISPHVFFISRIKVGGVKKPLNFIPAGYFNTSLQQMEKKIITFVINNQLIVVKLKPKSFNPFNLKI